MESTLRDHTLIPETFIAWWEGALNVGSTILLMGTVSLIWQPIIEVIMNIDTEELKYFMYFLT